MKVKNKEITISKNYIVRCYKEGHYVEAVVLAHFIVHVHMSMTYDAMVGLMNPFASIQRVTKKKGKGDLYPLPTQELYSFYIICNILFDMGIYNEELYDRLTRLNKYRNDVVHKLFKKLLSKQEFKEYFELGIELWEETWKILVKHRIKRQREIMKTLELQNEKSEAQN